MSKLVEEWRDIAGYEGLYEVSDWGRVRNIKTSLLRKPQNGVGGYQSIRITVNGETKHFYIHRLVYETFNGIIPSGMQVNHIDENKTNNHIDNLNLMTPKENSNHGTRNKRISEYKLDKHPKAQKIAQYTLNGELVKIYPSTRRAELDGFGHTSINRACKGLYKQYNGFIWKYI